MIARISERNPKMAKVRKRLKPFLFPIVRMRVLSMRKQQGRGSFLFRTSSGLANHRRFVRETNSTTRREKKETFFVIANRRLRRRARRRRTPCWARYAR
jgi:hypothetical protein